jgi:urease accessory protein
MIRSATLNLKTLQHGDSFFPSAAVSFSWGLEAMVNSKTVTNATHVAEFLSSHLFDRWLNFDRPIIHYARTEVMLEKIIDLDHLVHAQCLPAEQRSGSIKMGSAILNVHKELETPGANDLIEEISKGNFYGHLSVVQGFLWQKINLELAHIDLISVHSICMNILSAAVRLSVVGYLDAQKIYTNLQPNIIPFLDTAAPEINQLHSFTPQIDIASMNHESDEMRMFSN